MAQFENIHGCMSFGATEPIPIVRYDVSRFRIPEIVIFSVLVLRAIRRLFWSDW